MIGAGSWGTALTWLLTNNGHHVTVWSALGAEIEMLQEKREQKDKLPGVILSEDTIFKYIALSISCLNIEKFLLQCLVKDIN